MLLTAINKNIIFREQREKKEGAALVVQSSVESCYLKIYKKKSEDFFQIRDHNEQDHIFGGVGGVWR